MYSKFVDYFSIYKQTLCLHLTSTNFKVKGILRIFFFFFFFFCFLTVHKLRLLSMFGPFLYFSKYVLSV